LGENACHSVGEIGELKRADDLAYTGNDGNKLGEDITGAVNEFDK
jgi:hypothetical protein